MRNLKTLGLALVAMLAMSGLAASAAQAEFTLGPSPTKVTATQLAGAKFTLTVGGTKCTNVSGEAAVSTTTETELTFTNLAFTNCECLGLECHVKAEGGCTLTLTTSGESHLCPTGGSITMTITSGGVSVCTIHYKQHTINGITLDNKTDSVTGKMDILATVNATNLEYETTGPKTPCGEPGPFTCGLLKAEFTLKGLSGPTPIDLTHS